MVVAEVSIFPIGTGEPSVSEYVAAAANAFEEAGLKCSLNPMGTTVEAGSAEEIYSALGDAREAVFGMGAQRVYTVVKLDERRDEDRSAEDMTRAVRGE